MERTLARGGVRLVAASMASNVTGELLPWRQRIALSHQYGALCLLDGAQVAGWMDLDLLALGVDLFAFAGHKGPQGPSGVGGLYVRDGSLRPGYCDTGSVNLPALCGLAAGLGWMRRARPLAAALGCVSLLRARGVVASAGTQCAPLAHRALGTAPRGTLRISFGPGQDLADAGWVASQLIEAL